MDELKKEVEELKIKNNNLQQENEELIIKLKSYTNRPSKNKNYYERHKEVILERKKQKYEEAKLKDNAFII